MRVRVRVRMRVRVRVRVRAGLLALRECEHVGGCGDAA